MPGTVLWMLDTGLCVVALIDRVRLESGNDTVQRLPHCAPQTADCQLTIPELKVRRVSSKTVHRESNMLPAVNGSREIL